MLFHCYKGCTNSPQCYVIRTLPAWFVYLVPCLIFLEHIFISHTARPEVTTACTPVLSDIQSCRQLIENVPYFNYMCACIVVGIATGPWAGRSKFRTPAGREIFSSPKLSAQPASSSTGIGLLFRG